MRRVLVLNGPNLNLLGTREPGIYGSATLADIEAHTRVRAAALDIEVEFRQTNGEGELVTWVQEARRQEDGTGFDGLIVNAGAYSHTSVALLDALKSCDLPVVEVHLSNLYKREAFRHHSYVSAAAVGVIAGFGGLGYQLAVEALAVEFDKS